MTHIIHGTLEIYHHVFNELVDHRTDDWPFMGSPWPTLMMAILYLYFIKRGPGYMKHAAAFNLDTVICFYNVVQIVACTYLVIKACALCWSGRYRIYCEPVDYSDTTEAIEIAGVVYLFYLLKILDLSDTIFFILRKKQNQVTFFHVFHHVVMLVFGWFHTKYYPGGHGTSVSVVISFGRIFMYAYYLIANLFPSLIDASWFRKRLSELLLVQSAVMMAHYLPLFLMSDCEYPKLPIYVIFTFTVVFIIFFCKYYKQSHAKEKNA